MLERQSLMNSHQQSWWINLDLAQIVWSQASVARDAREHTRANLFSFMKREHEVGLRKMLQNLV